MNEPLIIDDLHQRSMDFLLSNTAELASSVFVFFAFMLLFSFFLLLLLFELRYRIVELTSSLNSKESKNTEEVQ